MEANYTIYILYAINNLQKGRRCLELSTLSLLSWRGSWEWSPGDDCAGIFSDLSILLVNMRSASFRILLKLKTNHSSLSIYFFTRLLGPADPDWNYSSFRAWSLLMRAEFHSISSISGILRVLMDFQPKFKVGSIQSTYPALVLFKSSDILTLLTMMISEVTLPVCLFY